MTIDDFLQRLKAVKKAAGGYVAKCPGHDDNHQSLSLRAADTDGRILVKCHAGCSAKQIVEAMGLQMKDLYPADSKPKRQARRIVATYDYTDEEGNVLYQVVRYEPKGFSQRRPDGNGGWIWNMDGVARVLYRLPKVMQAIQLNRPIFVCEGEKDVQTLEDMGLFATTNAGGAAKWHQSYTALLKQGKVVILPDNDPPGQVHADRVAEVLPDAAVVRLPGLPPKGDVTDWVRTGGSRAKLVDLVKRAWASPNATDTNAVSPPDTHQETDRPYDTLGYLNNTYYVWVKRTQSVQGHTSASLGRKSVLSEIASLNYWESNFPKRQSFDPAMVADHIIQECQGRGPFDTSRIRGRGAWWDEGRVVLHQGTDLMVDGVPTKISDIKSRYLYSSLLPLEYPLSPPAEVSLSSRVLELFQSLNWDTPLGGELLAGWTYLAPICGILPWRSHVWLTGAAGAGKSWALSNLLNPLIGSIAIEVQSSTTEAGVRQTVGADARPILFDEIEAEDVRTMAKAQAILELARACSTETGGSVVKGTPLGSPQTYLLRSSMLFSSINVPLRRRADISRFTVVSLAPNQSPQAEVQFEGIKAEAARIATKETAGALLSRACAHVGWLRDAAHGIAGAISRSKGNRRLGDQLGTLLAGYWGLTHDSSPSPSEIDALVSKINWDHLGLDGSSTDELQCLTAICQRIIGVEGIKTKVDRSIEELLWCIVKRNDIMVPSSAAVDALFRHGLCVEPNGVLLANRHNELSRLLQNTPYADNGWSRYLRRLNGVSTQEPRYWPGVGTIRATLVPLHYWGLAPPPETNPTPPPADNEEELPF